MPDNPKVTVLMPVYNGEKYLREALESILGQTFTDFEFLIINDGSTDGSAGIIRSYGDTRISLVENEQNLGLVATLNKGIDLARGEYIARMDCDDISLPERLEKQVVFMDAHPEIGVCGTWYQVMDEAKTVVTTPTNDHDIRWYLTITSSFGHPTVMIRKNILIEWNLRYDPGFIHAEDYELWTRIARHTNLANYPEVLLHYREHENQISGRFRSDQVHSANKVRLRQLSDRHLQFTDEEIPLHNSLVLRDYRCDINYLESAKNWLERLYLQAGDDATVYQKTLSDTFYELCELSTGLGLATFSKYKNSALSHYDSKRKVRLQNLLKKCILKKTRLDKFIR